MKIVTGEQAAQQDAKKQFKKDSGLTKDQFTEIFMSLVKTAAEAFRDKWNAVEDNAKIDVRFVMHRNEVKTHPTIKAQAMLTFELRTPNGWRVTSRVVKNFAQARALKEFETDYTFELWSDMFSEITQIGFVSVLNYIFAKENAATTIQSGAGSDTAAETSSQDHQQPVSSGDIEAIEDLSTKG